MPDHDKTRPECEHRMTAMETLLSNHIPHVNDQLKRMEKIMWGVFVGFVAELIGLLVYVIKGHIAF